MSQWAGIESAPGTARRPPQRAPMTARPARRLRRQERVILGSIDGAGHVLQRHAREVIVGSAIFLLPVVGLNLAVSLLAFDRFDSFSGSIVSAPELIGGVESATGVETLLAYLTLVTTALAAALIGGYVASILTAYQLGQPVRMSTALAATMRRLPALLVAWLVAHVWFLVAVLILVNLSTGDTATTALILGLPAVWLIATYTLLISPVIATERLGPFAGIRRAIRLSRRRLSTGMGFVLATALIGVSLRVGISLLPRLASDSHLITFGSYGWLVEGIAGQLAQLIVLPMIALATAQFYMQLRMHAEGMDITLAADDAFGPRAA